MYRIIISQKAYSSWSMRGWLLLDAFGLPYEEVFVPLYDPAFEAMKADKAPARTVPIIEWEEEDGFQRRVWDSIAIAETLAERHAGAGHWPIHPLNRAVGRVLAAEMHSGFTALRSACPMNLHRDNVPLKTVSGEILRDVARAGELWAWAIERAGGPWLAGSEFSAADAFYAPLATRLKSYGLFSRSTEAYATRLLEHESVARWVEQAQKDPQRLAVYDDIE